MTDGPTERYLVTMRSVVLLPNGATSFHESTDHVAPEHVAVYVADAQTRWQAVMVADQPEMISGPYDTVAATTAPRRG